MIRTIALTLLVAACTLDLQVGKNQPSPDLAEVALVPSTVNRNLDLLFVIDDSVGGSELQARLQNAFPSFVQELGSAPGGLPSLHLGVVTSDVGVLGDGNPLPAPNYGWCLGRGKDGLLQTSPAVNGKFIMDVDNGNGTRSTNYTTTLADAFTSISSLGSSGCGFEQPLHAAKRSFTQTANAGFHRPEATLAVVIVANEDDCSVSNPDLFFSPSQALGPMQSFRCTRYGVTCDQGGTTPEEMNALGTKTQCHANPASPYLTSIDAMAAYFKNLKTDARNVLVGAIAASASTIEVELRMPPSGDPPHPALKHACTTSVDTVPSAFDPSVRLTDFAQRFERSYIGQVCEDMTEQTVGLAREVRDMLGDACLRRDIALPAECEAWDVTATTRTNLPLCTSTPLATDCYQLVHDPTRCSGQGFHVEVSRKTAPTPGTMVSVRCRL